MGAYYVVKNVCGEYLHKYGLRMENEWRHSRREAIQFVHRSGAADALRIALTGSLASPTWYRIVRVTRKPKPPVVDVVALLDAEREAILKALEAKESEHDKNARDFASCRQYGESYQSNLIATGYHGARLVVHARKGKL